MASASLTTTSYAILGLLAVRPWSTYELTQQMDRSLGRFWPRAVSKLYEEPKKLVAHGLARASEERFGNRSRTVYTITAKGRRALARWLEQPGGGPVLEYEQLLHIFFSDNGTKADALATLDAARAWAGARSAEALAVGQQYVEGEGQFPERSAPLNVTIRFLIDFYALVNDWAKWAQGVVDTWPDDPAGAGWAPDLLEDNLRRLEAIVVDTHVASSG